MIAPACSALACPLENEQIKLSINGHALIAEVATNPTGHQCGLAFRDELSSDHGMLFVYPHEQMLRFWMKNTRIDLSIAYLDSDGKILEMHDMDSDDPYRQTNSMQPARYALEVNQGWFSDNGIKVGDRVEFDLQSKIDIFKNR
ncbi:MAG: DUF192 domain-containing protein [Gammaproteobacteria bacterium]|nr:DUF192 domain-containing protein [Gammaproteobacteria bacterium]